MDRVLRILVCFHWSVNNTTTCINSQTHRGSLCTLLALVLNGFWCIFIWIQLKPSKTEANDVAISQWIEPFAKRLSLSLLLGKCANIHQTRQLWILTQFRVFAVMFNSVIYCFGAMCECTNGTDAITIKWWTSQRKVINIYLIIPYGINEEH